MPLSSMGLGITLNAEDQASGVFKGAAKALGGLQGQAKSTGIAIADVGQSLKDWGAALTGIGKAGMGGLASAAEEASKFETSVARVATIADQAEFPMSKIRDIGFQMGEVYGGDLNTQLAALYSTIGSGANTAADATAVLNASNMLAIGGVTTVDKAMTLLMGTMNAYGMKLTDATKASDAFFMAVKLGGSDMSVETLGHSLAQVSPIAASFGVSLNDTLAALAQLTSVGLPTSQAVTGLKAAMEQMLKPTADATAEAKRLGIGFDAAALKSRGLGGIIEDINNSGKMQADTILKLFGGSVDSLAAMSELTKNGGANFRKFAEGMANAAGSSEMAFKTIAETAAFAGSVLKTNFQAAMVKAGDIIAPILGKIVVALNALLVKFNNLPSGVQSALVGIVAFGSAAALLVGGILTLAGMAIPLLALGWEVIAASVAAAIVLVAAFAVVLGGIAAVAFAVKTAFDQNLGGIADKFEALYDAGKLAMEGLSQLFSDGAFSGSVMAEMDKASNSGVQSFVVQLFMWGSRIKAFFQSIGIGFTSVTSTLGPVFDALFVAISKLGAAFGFAQDGPAAAASSFDAFAQAGSHLGSALASAFGFIVEAITTGIGIATAFISAFKMFAPSFGQIGSAVMNLVAAFGLIFAAFGAAQGSSQTTGSYFQMLASIAGGVAGAIVSVFTFLIDIVTHVVTIIASIVSGIVSILSGLYTAVAGVVNVLVGLFTGDFAQVWLGLKQIVFGVVQAIVGAVTMMVSIIATQLDTIGKMFGKDLGLRKAVEGAKVDMMGDLKIAMGLDDGKTAKSGGVTAAVQTVNRETPSTAVAPTAPGAPVRQGTTTVERPASPGAVAAAGVAAAPAAVVIPPPAPININHTTTLNVDGQVLAEVVERHQTSSGARGFGATPTAT